jgi:TonB-linked SusC/RagA family outer membrane protein
MKRYLYQIISMFLFAVIFASFINAQERNILTGQVNSPDGPVPGANIIVKGTTIGTVTDLDGNYTIEVATGDTLVFSFIGYLEDEMVYSNQKTYDVILIPDITELDHVVVIGYGDVKKKELTGAVSVVRGDKLENRQAASVQEVLQGQLAGVQVMSDGGAPGSEATILVRGISTVNNNNPLYIVDGSPLDDIEYLNPKDIESVQVLKDASASAIYGSKASNGVIIITTKRAKQGQSSISFDASFGLETAAKKPSMADASEYTRIANLANENSYPGSDPLYPDPDIFGTGTDWWEEVMQTGAVQNYNLNLSKGTQDYWVSTGANYFSQEGILKGGGYERFNFKLNSEFSIHPKVKIGENITLAKSTTSNGPNVVWDVQLAEPVTSVYRPDYEQEGLNKYSIFSPMITDISNPAGQIARSDSRTDYFRTVGNVYLSWEILSSLTFRSQYNLYLSNWEDNWFVPTYEIDVVDKQEVSSVGRTHNNRINQIWENYVTFNQAFGKHTLNVMGGFTLENFLHKQLVAEGKDTPNNTPSLRYLSATTGSWRADNWGEPSNEESSLQSYYGRAKYNYSGKYFISFSVRADGSSKFPEENRWGVFPAVSGAWEISQEGFLQAQSWISQLKLRAGWGQVGNQYFEPVWAKYSTMAFYYTTMGASQDVAIGAGPYTIGNNNLKWETVEDINLGLDFSALNEKIIMNVDFFNRKSRDMILWTPVPGYMGYGYVEQLTNIGEIEANGFEALFKYRDVKGDFRYELGFNISSVQTKLTKSAYGTSIQEGNHQRLNLLTNTYEGQTAGTFYGYVTDGIFQNWTEINSHSDNNGNLLQDQAQPGDFRFKDLNNDGILDDKDQQPIGNPEPLFTFGIPLNLSYKGFGINVLFTGSYGNDMLNAIRPYTTTGQSSYNSEAGLLNRAWRGEGTTNEQPILKVDDPNQNFRYSTYYIEDGSYIRLKNVQLGYSIPKKILDPIKIKTARIYISGENLFTLSNFSGLDPDIGGEALLRGVDWGHYPLPKRYTVGIKLTL